MRLLKKIAIKFITMAITVAVLGAAMRYAKPYIMKSAGMPEGMPGTEDLQSANFSSEESDLMGTVLKSALKFISGSASRDELSGELSEKLYEGRAGAATMSELGIELEKPGGQPADLAGLMKPGAGSTASTGGVVAANSQPRTKKPAKATQTAIPGAKGIPNPVRDALLGRLVEKAKANPELTLVPVVLLGMLIIHLFRRRRSLEDDFVLPDLSALIPSEEVHEMAYPVQSLQADDFELLVALIYQRQGYRVSMPAGLSGGRGGDFTLIKKSERLLVQCKKTKADYKVPVDRVRELHEAAIAAGARGLFVATCGFSWDSRNFAKTKGVIVVNARILDTLLDRARETPDEDFLEVGKWAPKLMSKVKLTPPICPACEAPMEEIKGSFWLCTERPECRGRRPSRKSYKPVSAATEAAPLPVSDVAPQPVLEAGSKPASNAVSTVASKPALKSASKAVATASKPASNTAPKPGGNKASKSAIKAASKAAATAASKTASNAGSKPAPSAAPEPAANVASEPASDVATKVAPTTASKAVSDVALKVVSKATDAAKAAAKVASAFSKSAREERKAMAESEKWRQPGVFGGRARTVCPQRGEPA